MRFHPLTQNTDKMTDTSAAVAASKVKKAAAKPKKPASHTKYSEMIAAALGALKERCGSSRQAILKYIQAKYKCGDNATSVNAHLKLALKSGVKTGAIKQSKGTGAPGSFKLGEQKKAAKKTTKPKAAKPMKAKTPKKKVAAKKPASAKKAAKPKTAVKKTAVKKVKTPKTLSLSLSLSFIIMYMYMYIHTYIHTRVLCLHMLYMQDFEISSNHWKLVCPRNSLLTCKGGVHLCI